MNPKDRDRIDLCCADIVSRIDMVRLWPKLLEYKIYNRDDVNIPRWTKNLSDPAIIQDVYLTIKTRGPYAFSNLLTSLRQTGHENLADTLEGCKMANTNNNAVQNTEERVPNKNETNLESEDLLTESNRRDTIYYNVQSSNKPLQIKVIKAKSFLDGPIYKNIQRYPMRTKPHGLVLIISNVHYHNEQSRYSAIHDEKNLKALFEQMGFQVFLYHDLVGEELIEKVREFSHRDFRHVDSCFVIITSHGGKDELSGETEIQGVDYHHWDKPPSYKKVLCTDIMNFFTSAACPHLANKPKVFIFQLCRGSKRQKAVTVPRAMTDTCVINEPESSKTYTNVQTTRNYSDMLVAHATMPGHVAFRDSLTGSWFISILCDVFMKHAHNTHIQDLLNMVDARLDYLRAGDNECQTLTVETKGWNKHCYLNPGLFEE